MPPWASYQIRKIAGCACAGNAGKVFPRRRFQKNPLVSDPGMHHGTCVTHVPWYMSGSLTCGDGENVPGIPRACAPAFLLIWQEAHCPIDMRWWTDSALVQVMVCRLAPSHYLNQCCFIVNRTLRNKLQWNANRYTRRFIQGNVFENDVCHLIQECVCVCLGG